MRERLVLATIYKHKTVNKWTDAQVIAIYRRLQSKGRIRI